MSEPHLCLRWVKRSLIYQRTMELHPSPSYSLPGTLQIEEPLPEDTAVDGLSPGRLRLVVEEVGMPLFSVVS
ncbi:hypothetical protein SAY86_000364 [Trapa natans]|uniref:Uncharacterized protein n=1 Tax=Trapa natans TaxID=22666 RepID=A0AAN7MY04_TRANT|nr:hypothetical protein SAY86_000364 [Trapa natans]